MLSISSRVPPNEQGVMNFQRSVVLDKSQLTKFIHESAHARPRGADHLGKSFLAYFRYDRFQFSFLKLAINSSTLARRFSLELKS
jgi:hypothetical protein